jgi:hypothetical protein
LRSFAETVSSSGRTSRRRIAPSPSDT